MDNIEAKNILEKQLSRYRSMSYAELLRLMDKPESLEVKADSGRVYGLEVEVDWDNEPGKELRVIGSIDDGGWRSLSPPSNSFIMREDGSFVGE